MPGAAEQVAQESRHRGPGARILGQRPLHHAPDAVVEAVEPGLLVDDPIEDLARRSGAERVPARPGVRDHPAPREHVGRGRERLAARLLRRHERGRAEDGLADQALGVDELGDAEVDHPGPERGEQHVGRLEVAVDHPGAVDGAERGRDPHRERLQVAAGQRPLITYGLRQVRAFDVLGDEVGDVPVDPGVQHRGGAEPGHPAGGGHLPVEPAAEGGVAGQRRVDHLDRGQPSGGRGGQMHLAHAAPAEHAPQHIAA